MSSLFYFFKESLTGFTRNLSTTLGSIITIFLSLLIIGIFLVGGLIVDNTVKSVGTLITLLSNYVFPVVKEDVLEIMIKQTEYCGPDAYPVIELDNRKVFTDLEKDDDFDGDAHSIMTSQCMFAQLYHQMKHVNCDVLRAKLDSKDRVIAIKYKGEQGLDWGGLYRDTIERW